MKIVPSKSPYHLTVYSNTNGIFFVFDATNNKIETISANAGDVLLDMYSDGKPSPSAVIAL